MPGGDVTATKVAFKGLFRPNKINDFLSVKAFQWRIGPNPLSRGLFMGDRKKRAVNAFFADAIGEAAFGRPIWTYRFQRF